MEIRRTIQTMAFVSITLAMLGSALGQTPTPARKPPATPSVDPQKPTPAGDEVSVKTRVEAEDPMHVADRADVVIEIVHPEGWTVEEPDPARLNTGRYRVLDVAMEELPPSDGKQMGRVTLTTTLYRVGRFYLPPLQVVLKDADGKRRFVETEQVSVKVVSVVLDELEDATLRDVRGPARLFEPDMRWAWAGGIAVGVLFLLGVGFVVARRMKARKPARKAVWKPPRPAWEVALERLRALQSEDWPVEAGAVREFYFHLSETIREYIGARYGFESLELTTSELIDRLSRYSLPPSVDKIGLENFLLDCDLVKFARYRASVEELAGAHAFAVELVEKTRPRPRASDKGGPPPKKSGGSGEVSRAA